MNRIFSNVWLIDSGGLWLTSNSAQSGTALNSEITGIRFVSTNSGKMELTLESDTALNVLFSSFNGADYSNDSMQFSGKFKVSEKIFVRTLTAGTGWVYFA